MQFAVLFACLSAVVLAGCTSVPGETLAPRGMKGDIEARVLALARGADAQCQRPKISNTEVVEVYPDAKPAQERWTVDQCGRSVNYVVSFAAARRGSAFSVKPER